MTPPPWLGRIRLVFRTTVVLMAPGEAMTLPLFFARFCVFFKIGYFEDASGHDRPALSSGRQLELAAVAHHPPVSRLSPVRSRSLSGPLKDIFAFFWPSFVVQHHTVARDPDCQSVRAALHLPMKYIKRGVIQSHRTCRRQYTTRSKILFFSAQRLLPRLCPSWPHWPRPKVPRACHGTRRAWCAPGTDQTATPWCTR